MLRPSSLGDDSAKPSSTASSASFCGRRKPSSGRDCSRPRNMIVHDLVPGFKNRSTLALLGAVVVDVDLGPGLISLMTVLTWFLRASRAFMAASWLELAVVHELGHRRLGHQGDLDQVSSASAARRSASSTRTMPTCSPLGPTSRTSGTRMRSLMRALADVVLLLVGRDCAAGGALRRSPRDGSREVGGSLAHTAYGRMPHPLGERPQSRCDRPRRASGDRSPGVRGWKRLPSASAEHRAARWAGSIGCRPGYQALRVRRALHPAPARRRGAIRNRSAMTPSTLPPMKGTETVISPERSGW